MSLDFIYCTSETCTSCLDPKQPHVSPPEPGLRDVQINKDRYSRNFAVHGYYRKRGRSVSGFVWVLFVGRNYVLINLRKEAAHK